MPCTPAARTLKQAPWSGSRTLIGHRLHARRIPATSSRNRRPLGPNRLTTGFRFVRRSASIFHKISAADSFTGGARPGNGEIPPGSESLGRTAAITPSRAARSQAIGVFGWRERRRGFGSRQGHVGRSVAEPTSSLRESRESQSQPSKINSILLTACKPVTYRCIPSPRTLVSARPPWYFSVVRP